MIVSTHTLLPSQCCARRCLPNLQRNAAQIPVSYRRRRVTSHRVLCRDRGEQACQHAYRSSLWRCSVLFLRRTQLHNRHETRVPPMNVLPSRMRRRRGANIGTTGSIIRIIIANAGGWGRKDCVSRSPSRKPRNPNSRRRLNLKRRSAYVPRQQEWQAHPPLPHATLLRMQWPPQPRRKQ